MVDVDEVLENPGFWILAGGGIAMEILGWTVGRNMGIGSFPIWQLLIIMIGTVIASAFFAMRG
ncbi:MAG TPA: hypothetical protein VJ438_05375 [Candidatus Nanoarchaeia archaeon]|nr:hypothetical protein [Candidatus Nanoarchaeia archaeon]